jgi:hypothetical protein
LVIGEPNMHGQAGSQLQLSAMLALMAQLSTACPRATVAENMMPTTANGMTVFFTMFLPFSCSHRLAI